MAEKVIRENKTWVPFMGDRMSFVRGLDPLGLQNASTQTYAYLQPGLNNVTTHIRSYSFYCWLLEEYAKRIKSTDPYEQQVFIRRAEYILALVATRKPEIKGISGSNYVTRHFDEYTANFDLEEGTYTEDGKTRGTYWQYYLGVYGQYYVGSLRQIGLVEEPVDHLGHSLRIYRRTSADREELEVSGEDLAKAFEANISPENKEVFLNAIDKATISKEELYQIKTEFDLTKIKADSEEAKLLYQLLRSVDEPTLKKENPTTLRRATIDHLLELEKQNSKPIFDRLFTFHAYDVKGIHEKEQDECLTGWYFYQFNEYWQFACTAMLNGLLSYLEDKKGPQWMNLYELVETCTKDVVAIIEEEYGEYVINRVADIRSIIRMQEEELYDCIKQQKLAKKVAASFLLLWKIYEENQAQLGMLSDYLKERAIGSKNQVLDYFLNFEREDQKPLEEFIQRFLLHKIIHRHQYVAYRKMGSGTQSTQKFIIEENYIRQIDNFKPEFTGPRVGNLISFLQDLHLLKIKENNTDELEET